MKTIIEMMSEVVSKAYEALGYDKKYGEVTLSNRPDICQFQNNGALRAAKEYKKAPIMIAKEISEQLKTNAVFSYVEALAPGFININLSHQFIVDYLNKYKDNNYGIEKTKNPMTIIVDYGGANIAKPLHVGHLRPAIIGESIKRISKFLGHNVIGDAHLGDWGLPIGLIIVELKRRKANLPYFDKSFTNDYPKEPPFTIEELEEIYPHASKISKIDSSYKEEAKNAVLELQNGNKGYYQLWKHIVDVSIKDLKRVYDSLAVHFELWKKESDVKPYIPDMVKKMKDDGYAYIDDGALIVDVEEETDKRKVPPCLILKSDGAALYETTDLATLVERQKLYQPDKIIYVVDARQEMHFTKVFRCAKKTKIIDEDVQLDFIGFGTMNGKDGKPFKTRDGGIMRLETLFETVKQAVYKKVITNKKNHEENIEKRVDAISLAAIKYRDLSNQPARDYIFDIDKFTASTGNTGPYILYTIVRIKSILSKYDEIKTKEENNSEILPPSSKSELDLDLILCRFNQTIYSAFEDNAPNHICHYIYELANQFNTFYHETMILSEKNETLRQSYINLISLVLDILETSIKLLGFESIERM